MEQVNDSRSPHHLALPRPLHQLAVWVLRTPLGHACALGSVAVLLATGAVGMLSPAAEGTIHGGHDKRGIMQYVGDAAGATSTTTYTPVPAHLAPVLRLGQVLGGGDGGNDEHMVAGAGRRAVEYGIRTDRGLSAADRSQLMAWLNGDPLLDPRLVDWVGAATLGHPVEGAGPLARCSATPLRR